MRIGLFNPYYFSQNHLGGTERIVSLLLRGLGESSIEAEVFPSNLKRYGSLYDPFFRNDVLKACSPHISKFDIIHSHKPEIGSEVFEQDKLITTFHTLKYFYGRSLPLSPAKLLALTLGSWYDRRSFRKSQIAVAVSESETNEMQKLFGSTNAKITTIRNGIDLEHIQEMEGTCEKSADVFFVGRLSRQKSIHTIIEAIARLKHKNIHPKTVIAGSGGEEEKLKSLAHSLGVSNYIQFPGKISEEEKFAYFSNSKVVVISSLYESCGIVLMEAMAAGANLICTDIPPFRELGCDAAEYFKTRDATALATLLSKNLEDRQEKRKLARKISRIYDYRIMTKQYIESYKRMQDQ